MGRSNPREWASSDWATITFQAALKNSSRSITPQSFFRLKQQARQFVIQLCSNLSPEEEYNVRHQDYVMEMPQSGERFRGRENMRAFQRARDNHATPPRSFQLRRVLVKEGLWVVEAVIDYGDGRVYEVALILELRDGKMWRDRWYFAEPFEAPEWRAQ
jgi:hypothetical protein